MPDDKMQPSGDERPEPATQEQGISKNSDAPQVRRFSQVSARRRDGGRFSVPEKHVALNGPCLSG
jgi:hypothetical protein